MAWVVVLRRVKQKKTQTRRDKVESARKAQNGERTQRLANLHSKSVVLS
jgi:hypothetical protein